MLHRRRRPPALRYLHPGRGGCPGAGAAGMKPEWCCQWVYFSHLMAPQEVDYVICAGVEVATLGWKRLLQYDVGCSSGEHHVQE